MLGCLSEYQLPHQKLLPFHNEPTYLVREAVLENAGLEVFQCPMKMNGYPGENLHPPLNFCIDAGCRFLKKIPWHRYVELAL